MESEFYQFDNRNNNSSAFRCICVVLEEPITLFTRSWNEIISNQTDSLQWLFVYFCEFDAE